MIDYITLREGLTASQAIARSNTLQERFSESTLLAFPILKGLKDYRVIAVFDESDKKQVKQAMAIYDLCRGLQ